jgi:hypothetical protein
LPSNRQALLFFCKKLTNSFINIVFTIFIVLNWVFHIIHKNTLTYPQYQQTVFTFPQKNLSDHQKDFLISFLIVDSNIQTWISI